MLAVMLRHHDTHGGYTWHHKEVDFIDLDGIFRDYLEMPEMTLQMHFGWKDQKQIQPSTVSRPEVRTSTVVLALGLDLLDDLL